MCSGYVIPLKPQNTPREQYSNTVDVPSQTPLLHVPMHLRPRWTVPTHLLTCSPRVALLLSQRIGDAWNANHHLITYLFNYKNVHRSFINNSSKM